MTDVSQNTTTDQCLKGMFSSSQPVFSFSISSGLQENNTMHSCICQNNSNSNSSLLFVCIHRMSSTVFSKNSNSDTKAHEEESTQQRLRSLTHSCRDTSSSCGLVHHTTNKSGSSDLSCSDAGSVSLLVFQRLFGPTEEEEPSTEPFRCRPE